MATEILRYSLALSPGAVKTAKIQNNQVGIKITNSETTLYKVDGTLTGPTDPAGTALTTTEVIIEGASTISFASEGYTEAVVCEYEEGVSIEGNKEKIESISAVTKEKLDDEIPNNYTSDIDPKNLYDESTSLNGFVIDASGNVVELSAYNVSDFIPVTQGQDYQVKYARGNYVHFYDASQNWLGLENVASPQFDYVFNADNYPTAVFFRFNVYVDESEGWYLYEYPIPTNKIVMSALGDSLTEDGFLLNPGERSWPYWVGGYSDLYVQNLGIGGSPIANVASVDSFVERYTQIRPDANIIFLLGSRNDYNQDAVIGATTSTTDTEFNGALNIILTALKESHPEARIIMITPPRTTDAKSGANGIGNTYQDYIDAYLAMAKKYQCPVVDLWNEGECSPRSASQKALYFQPDEIHFQESYHKRVANYVIGKITTNFY